MFFLFYKIYDECFCDSINCIFRNLFHFICLILPKFICLTLPKFIFVYSYCFLVMFVLYLFVFVFSLFGYGAFEVEEYFIELHKDNHNITLYHVNKKESFQLILVFCLIVSVGIFINNIVSALGLYIYDKYYKKIPGFSLLRPVDRCEYFINTLLIVLLFLFFPLILCVLSAIHDVNTVDVILTYIISIISLILCVGGLISLTGPFAIITIPLCLYYLVGCGIYSFYERIAEDESLEELGDAGWKISGMLGIFCCPMFIPFIPALLPLVE